MEAVEQIVSRILLVRRRKVMLDADLAALYGVRTKRFNEQVRRNRDRFPTDFMFRLTDQEVKNVKSQFATSSLGHRQTTWGGQRYLPFAFTEHGAIMAATILNTPRATEVSVFVVRAFVRLREMVAANKELAKSPQHNETHAALSRFWLHGQDGPVSAARMEIAEREALSQNRASPQGVAARIGTGFVARLANIDILTAPRFAPLPILARTARAFHHVAGSRNSTSWNAASRITTRRSPASSRRFANSPRRPSPSPGAASDSFPATDSCSWGPCSPLSSADQAGGRRRALGEPRVPMIYSERCPPDSCAVVQTVRELRSRPAWSSSAGNRYKFTR